MQTYEKEAVLDERVDGLYRVVKGKLRWDNLVPSSIEVAREIEGIQGLKGPEKLALLQKTLRYALKESDKTPTEKEQLLHVIDTILPLVVQAAILASKMPIVGKVETVCIGCCARF